MNDTAVEPAATIRAELARRRRTVGWLSAATGLPSMTLQRRLATPEKFTLPELAAIATALDIDESTLLSGWLSRNGASS